MNDFLKDFGRPASLLYKKDCSCWKTASSITLDRKDGVEIGLIFDRSVGQGMMNTTDCTEKDSCSV